MAIVPFQLWVTANFKETQLAHMRPGQPVSVHVDACPGRTFRGHVNSIQRGAGQAFAILPPENATGNYVKVVQRVPVKILIDRSRAATARWGPACRSSPRCGCAEMAETDAPQRGDDGWTPARSVAGERNPWSIVAVISIATFMTVLDTSIANVALHHIAGSLAAPATTRRPGSLTTFLVARR